MNIVGADKLKVIILIPLLLIACVKQQTQFNPQPDRARQLAVVDTTHGRVAGYVDSSGLNVFLGIPYAEPPAGRLRFAPPQPVSSWPYVRPAYRFGPTCPQVKDEYEPSSLLFQDEDCLSLNIWTPGIDTRNRPVMVYIHGGGFVNGGTADPLYNGEYLAKRGDIVVASINYRVAALGFLALDRFGPEFKGSGNLAIQDQIAGLTWIKNNISRFGGDPNNITIMGESAGSASVMCLMISPGGKSLFKKAIAHSGAINLTRTQDLAERYTRKFMEMAGVKDVEGLRALPFTRIVELERKMLDDAGFEADLLFAPVRDNILVPADPVKAFEEGAAKNIAFLNGTNNDEYRYWILYSSILKYLPVKMMLSNAPNVREKLDSHLEKIIDYYDHTLLRPGLGGKTLALGTDMMFRVPHIRVSDLQSRYAPVWMYRFDWRSQVSEDLGACHAIELPFVLRTFDSPTRYQIVGADPPMRLSDTMMDAWISFIRTGNPDTPGLSWPAYNEQRRATMIFNVESRVQDDPDRDIRMLYSDIDTIF
jgi:para-nitrobenzyl esterase